MKKITVQTWTLDNVGNYARPGTELTVSADVRDGCIDADRAEELAARQAERAAQAAAAAVEQPAAE